MKPFLMLGAAVAAWLALYTQLQAFSVWAAGLLPADTDERFADAFAYFLYDAPKILLLLTAITFCVGVLRSFLNPHKVRAFLSGKREGVANVLAACLGIVTPFCSCSAVSLFVGFVSAGVPLGTTFSFLISAPMVNEVALVLLFGLLGWKVATAYLVTGLLIAIIAGTIIGRLHMEPYLQDWVRAARADTDTAHTTAMGWSDRFAKGVQVMRDVLFQVGHWVLVGVFVGAGVHGYVPQTAVETLMGQNAFWSVPLAVLVGVPLYSNAAGMIPVVQALLAKGAALGTTLALMMSVIGLSLPEIIILRNVLKMRLIWTFVGIVACGILAVGWLFNAFFPAAAITP